MATADKKASPLSASLLHPDADMPAQQPLRSGAAGRIKPKSSAPAVTPAAVAHRLDSLDHAVMIALLHRPILQENLNEDDSSVRAFWTNLSAAQPHRYMYYHSLRFAAFPPASDKGAVDARRLFSAWVDFFGHRPLPASGFLLRERSFNLAMLAPFTEYGAMAPAMHRLFIRHLTRLARLVSHYDKDAAGQNAAHGRLCGAIVVAMTYLRQRVLANKLTARLEALARLLPAELRADGGHTSCSLAACIDIHEKLQVLCAMLASEGRDLPPFLLEITAKLYHALAPFRMGQHFIPLRWGQYLRATPNLVLTSEKRNTPSSRHFCGLQRLRAAKTVLFADTLGCNEPTPAPLFHPDRHPFSGRSSGQIMLGAFYLQVASAPLLLNQGFPPRSGAGFRVIEQHARKTDKTEDHWVIHIHAVLHAERTQRQIRWERRLLLHRNGETLDYADVFTGAFTERIVAGLSGIIAFPPAAMLTPLRGRQACLFRDKRAQIWQIQAHRGRLAPVMSPHPDFPHALACTPHLVQADRCVFQATIACKLA